MEQQSISISKAGIVTTLQARCAIVAAANPIRGRYNPTIPFSQNVELTEPILSRFDILCVVKDEADPSIDEMLANFVVGSHLRSHPNFDADKDEVNASGLLDADVRPSLSLSLVFCRPLAVTRPLTPLSLRRAQLIPQDLLRKYIQYARDRVKPALQMMDQEKISRLYSELRRESLSTGSYPITVRHLESMIRMAEASAKMHLREYVRSDDIDLAIQVMVGSFVSAQKSSIKKQLQRGFRSVDFLARPLPPRPRRPRADSHLANSKYLRVAKDNDEVLAFLLGNLVKDRVRYLTVKNDAQPDTVSIRVEELARKAAEIDIHDVQPFFSSPLFVKVHRYQRKGDSIVKSFV